MLQRFPEMTLEEDESANQIVSMLLEASVLGEDTEVAGQLARRLTSFASEISFPHYAAFGRLLGEAVVLSGDPEQARGYYGQGLELCEKVHFRPEAALIHLDLAELLLQHFPDEQAKALRHLDFAIEECRAMKMQPHLERALRHKGLLHA